MDKYADLTNEALAALAAEKRGAFDALVALDAPTIAQVDEAEALAVELDEIATETADRQTASNAAAEKFAALKGKFAKVSDPEGSSVADSPEDGERVENPSAPAEVESDDDEDDEEDANHSTPDEAPKKGSAARAGVATLAARTTRPVKPSTSAGVLSITAAADSGFAVGSRLDGIDQIGEAVVNRMRGFTPPTGDGETENLQKFGVASLHLPFSDDLTVDRGSDDMAILANAANEARLPGNSLVAAGGWCAPSETIYDLCSGETLEGLVSIPEINIKRGGLRYTRGPDFADFYGTANGFFVQTETQAIAGATKPCVTVDCPAFTEVRLDAVGLCIKIPILTNAAYPELVQRYVSGFMTAYEHRYNAEVITRMLALTPAARTFTGMGSSVIDSLDALILVADQRRQQRRLSMNQSFEVIAPFWVKNMLLADLRARGFQSPAATDAALSALFSAAKLNVQFVYDWQDLPLVDNVATTGVNEANTYPTTYNVLMYPAGTFVKGTSDVINLSAVYDAASLAVNVYTGLFMESGLLVAKMCNNADLLTLPVCNAGRTGAHNLTCS